MLPLHSIVATVIAIHHNIHLKATVSVLTGNIKLILKVKKI